MAIDNKDKKVLNVPHLRFPEFSGEWENTELQYIAPNICSGKDKPTSNGTVALYGSTGIIGMTRLASYNEEIVLVARVGANAGQLQITTIPCGVTDNTLIINAKEWNRYIYYYLQHYNLNRLVFGSGQPLITGSMLKKLKIIYGEESERNKIVNLLCLLDERIATQNKIIEDLKKLKCAITDLLFHSIADAHTIRLGEIAHITNGAGDVQDANTEHQKDWYPFFDRSEELKWFPTYSFDKEAVIYAGEGQSFYPRYYNGKFALHQRCYAITDFASCIIPKYCYHFMNTLNSYFVRNSVGSTVPSLRMDIFQKVEIRLPPIPKQQHICKIIDAFYTKLEVEQRGISILQELKQFLLSQMFI